jgi:hypothetical protein
MNNIAEKQVIAQEKQAKKSLVLADYEKYRVSHSSDIADETPIIFINDRKIAVNGDISFITGQPKAGKTSIAAFIIATALMENIPNELDTLKIKSNYCKGKKIIYIDTEQPYSQTNKLRKRVCRILGTDKEPDNLHILNIRSIARKEKKNEVFEIIDNFRNDLHFIIIDGIADLVKDPNIADESFDLIDDLMRKALLYNIPILAYIHLNPNSDKVRGNLGSEADRKCGASVSIKKDSQTGIHSIESRYMRYDGDIETVHFRYDNEINDFRTLTGNEAKQAKEKENLEKIEFLKEVAYQATAGGRSEVGFTQFVEIVMSHFECEERTAKTRIKEMISLEIVNKEKKGKEVFYSLNKIES